MSETYQVLSDYSRLLANFTSDFFKESEASYRIYRIDDFDPTCMITVDHIQTDIERLIELKTDIPIEWQFGQYVMENASDMLFYRIINSSTVREGLEATCQYQRLITNFLTIQHKFVKNGGLKVTHTMGDAVTPVTKFVFRSYVSMAMILMSKYCTGFVIPQGLDAKVNNFGEMLNYIIVKNDYMKMNYGDNYFFWHYTPKMLNSQIFDQEVKLRNLLEFELKKKAPNFSQYDNLTDKIRDYIKSIHATEVSLDKLCEELHISKRTLNRLLQKEGTTFTDILQRVRMEEAIPLIRNKEIPLKRVALESGFKYISSFNMAFKSFTGMTPGAYRKSATQMNE